MSEFPTQVSFIVDSQHDIDLLRFLLSSCNDTRAESILSTMQTHSDKIEIVKELNVAERIANVENENGELKARLFIGTDKLAEGNAKDISARFHDEIKAHSGPVSVKVFRNGEWQTTLKRRG